MCSSELSICGEAEGCINTQKIPLSLFKEREEIEGAYCKSCGKVYEKNPNGVLVPSKIVDKERRFFLPELRTIVLKPAN